jgi:hypothetical protein
VLDIADDRTKESDGKTKELDDETKNFWNWWRMDHSWSKKGRIVSPGSRSRLLVSTTLQLANKEHEKVHSILFLFLQVFSPTHPALSLFRHRICCLVMSTEVLQYEQRSQHIGECGHSVTNIKTDTNTHTHGKT